MNELASADYVVITSFFVVMLSIGFYFRNRMKSMFDFFGGGKQVPWWLGGISFYMCSFSALAFVMYSALAYRYGFVAVTIWWVSVPIVFLVTRLFACRWRRLAENSPLEYIENRYGNKMRQSLVLLGLPTRILDDALKLLAIGTVVAVGMGFPLRPAIIISGLIMVSYTFMGGLWATLVADFIQFIVLVAAVAVLPFLALEKVGGISNFIAQAPDGFFDFTTPKYSYVYLFVMMVILFLNYSTSWALVQRFYSAKNDRNARKVGYLVAILNIIGPPVFYLPAMMTRIFVPDIPVEEMNGVYAIMCKSLLPVGMLGMVIAAMFAATMSTLAGDFNAISSVLTNDVFKRVIFPKASNRILMTASRVNTLIVGLLIIGITFFLQKAQGSDDLIRVMVKIFGIFLPPVAIPMLLGMLTPKVSKSGGLAGLIAGICSGLLAFFLSKKYPVLLYEPVILSITSITTFLGLCVGTLVLPDRGERAGQVIAFFERLNNPDIKKTEEQDVPCKGFSPFPMIGIGIAFIGIVLACTVFVSGSLKESIMSVIVGLSMAAVGLIFIYLGCRDRKAVK